ncbi:hypothetical protein BofuT4_P098880.1 [Botrytis cinerea T4]|uniref:Uncharacterized protein n=1 Tax=Botryotinia fuckeliana (strain T4) TaxID=999810 RepID=G2YC91_BOTF4|nr:hypothetical protein BofuT4_P098880.1 [Botrytis cinerea T4]
MAEKRPGAPSISISISTSTIIPFEQRIWGQHQLPVLEIDIGLPVSSKTPLSVCRTHHVPTSHRFITIHPRNIIHEPREHEEGAIVDCMQGTIETLSDNTIIIAEVDGNSQGIDLL